MSRQEAAEQYAIALKAGQKCRKECLIQGKYPYPQVLDEIFDESMAAGRVELGTINIPTEHIVGTKTGGRQNAFAANFMPLLGEETEFAHKWISLCETNLSDEGIRDPIRCCEYMGRFYVQEGNKRVSVLKSFGAPSIPAVVTRIIPAWSQEHEVRLYYEFMRFYQLSRLYILSFSRLGSYVKLQAALGFDADHVWSEEERRSFSAAYYSFRTALEKCEGSRFPETIGDALLIFLQVFSFGELKAMTQTELEHSITGIWPEVEVQARPAPITVNTESSVEVKGVLTKLMDSIRLPSHLNVAFVNELPPEKSAWIMSHDRGREYLDQQDMGIDDIFTEDVIYTESWSPQYNNRKTVKHWFQEWNTRGKVVIWEIKQFFHKGDQTVVEWYFKNEMNNGDIEEFDGISLVEWTEDNKIKALKEFGCNRNTYNPYQEGDTPQFKSQKANWF